MSASANYHITLHINYLNKVIKDQLIDLKRFDGVKAIRVDYPNILDIFSVRQFKIFLIYASVSRKK